MDSKITLLQAVSAPLEIPTDNNFIKIEDINKYRRVYLQSHTSLARIVFKDKSTYCYNGGYFGDQLWQIDQVDGEYHTIRNISGNNAALFYNGKDVNCYNGQRYDDQLWSFQYSGGGYYRIINKHHVGSKLFLQSSETFGAYDGPNYDDQLWRIVPETCPLVTLYGMEVGARLVGNKTPFSYKGKVYKDQVWRFIPVGMEDDSTPKFFYIQNYANGLKLVHQTGGDFFAYDGNNYPDQQWEVKPGGGFVRITNRLTGGKLYAKKDGEVGSYKGPDYDDQKWMLISPGMKRLNIRCKSTLTFLSLKGNREWEIIPELNGGYFFQGSNNGERVYFDGKTFSSYDGPVYSDQIWFISKPHDFDTNLYQVTNAKYDGAMYSQTDHSVEVKLDPVPIAERDKTAFFIEWGGEAGTYNEDLIDEISDNNMFWLERESEGHFDLYQGGAIEATTILPECFGSDEEFFGFQGLDDECDCVYRVCRPDEEVRRQPIRCSDPDSPRTVEQHIASGSRNPSRFISTTSSLTVALLWAFYRMDLQTRPARPEPLIVVRIDLNRIRGTAQEAGCVNTNNGAVREHFIRGATFRNWARSSREVLFQDVIPREAFTILEDLERPPPPPRKRKRPAAYANLLELLEKLDLHSC